MARCFVVAQPQVAAGLVFRGLNPEPDPRKGLYCNKG